MTRTKTKVPGRRLPSTSQDNSSLHCTNDTITSPFVDHSDALTVYRDLLCRGVRIRTEGDRLVVGPTRLVGRYDVFRIGLHRADLFALVRAAELNGGAS